MPLRTTPASRRALSMDYTRDHLENRAEKWRALEQQRVDDRYAQQQHADALTRQRGQDWSDWHGEEAERQAQRDGLPSPRATRAQMGAEGQEAHQAQARATQAALDAEQRGESSPSQQQADQQQHAERQERQQQASQPAAEVRVTIAGEAQKRFTYLSDAELEAELARRRAARGAA